MLEQGDWHHWYSQVEPFGNKKVPRIENDKLIWIFNFYHDYSLNTLIILTCYIIVWRKRQDLERTESNQFKVIEENDPHDLVISALSIKANAVLEYHILSYFGSFCSKNHTLDGEIPLIYFVMNLKQLEHPEKLRTECMQSITTIL